MKSLQPPNAAADGGAYDTRTGTGAGCYFSSTHLAKPSSEWPLRLKGLLVRMRTHFFPGIPHGPEDIPEDVTSADGNGTRRMVDGDILEMAQINTDPVLQRFQCC